MARAAEVSAVVEGVVDSCFTVALTLSAFDSHAMHLVEDQDRHVACSPLQFAKLSGQLVAASR